MELAKSNPPQNTGPVINPEKNLHDEESDYSPVCLNQWKTGLCRKPKISCSKCKNKSYAALDKNVIEQHLRGRLVAGIYPMLEDETCWFLAMDFDKSEWRIYTRSSAII